MDIKQYISSGIVEDYCLGMLENAEALQVEQAAATYPEIKKEITAFQETLEKYAMLMAENPLPGLKNNMFDTLDNLAKEKTLSVNNLPLLNKYSDYRKWLKLVKPMLPEKLEEEIFIKVLRNKGGIVQSVIWLKNEYPDEVHEHLKESLIVLEGECECHIGDKVLKLGPGDYIDIPLYYHHDVKVVKGPVLGIVQTVKVA